MGPVFTLAYYPVCFFLCTTTTLYIKWLEAFPQTSQK